MGTLVCRVELNKTNGSGITIKVLNEEGKITQTIVMDGTSIITTCKGEQETSTITQKSESIAIKCKTFTLDAETITCTSTSDTKHESKAKFDILSTGDMKLDSKANITQSATSNVKVTATQNFEAAATMDAKVSGLNLTLESKLKTAISGTQAEMAGKAQAKVAAPMIQIAADGILTAEGQLASFKGSITKIG